MKPASPYDALETEPPLDYSVLSLELCKPKDFRLLEVRRTYEGGVIKCDLRVENLENNYPKYRALSYTWGPATRHELDRLPGGASDNEQRKHGILCNQQLLLVTKNLYDFLQQLSQASPLENEAIRYFWIDSICINQEDPDERASQVNMMSDIYRHAEEVVIWLGKSDEDTTLACNLVKKLGYLSQNERDSLDLESLRSKENITTPLGESHTSAHWKAVVELFGRTWFTRAWVVQEYVLARDVVVLCGSLTLDLYKNQP
ncbi:Heterokaryon incompatibility protein 6, OR allele [Cytospora mali]|uniref:Heterokaryon incompatibility protein 6, OR allele n=1 Tax=Cytospora mali TaxID=578113 RepID=A0A194VVT8_CYTMA|nr:Heterokaryon incompatibility protein 6, OR allele [Valsa mali]